MNGMDDLDHMEMYVNCMDDLDHMDMWEWYGRSRSHGYV